jgi:transcriptional regulator GlxA family with amidase domain
MLRIGFTVYPGYSVMAFAVISAFEIANAQREEPLYDIRLLSESGGPVIASAGIVVQTESFENMELDTLMVGGAMETHPSAPGLIAFVRQAATRFRRTAAICTGAFVLAEAGVLDGRRVTTHWLHARELQQRFPALRIDADRIFINDGSIWTSAGMTAGIDLALELIEGDAGASVARAVAKKLVVFQRRAGGQSQFSELLVLNAKSDRIQSALAFAKTNLQTPLSVADLAEVAHLSPRQFTRAFLAETGQSPAKAVENLRVEAARLMMEQGRHSIDFVAHETGFADRDRMRRAFLRAFGQPPQVYRRQARAQANA